jgi:hypothetical protein
MSKIWLAAALTLLTGLPLSAERLTGQGSPDSDGSVGQAGQSKSAKETEKDKVKASRLLCAVVTKYFEAGLTGYSELKSSRNFDDSTGDWIANDSGVPFPGARKCTIYSDRETGSNAYATCRLLVPTDLPTDEAVKKWNQEVVSAIKVCIPKGWTTHTDGEPHPEGYFSMEEANPGPRIEIQLVPTRPGTRKELQINFFPK